MLCAPEREWRQSAKGTDAACCVRRNLFWKLTNIPAYTWLLLLEWMDLRLKARYRKKKRGNPSLDISDIVLRFSRFRPSGMSSRFLRTFGSLLLLLSLGMPSVHAQTPPAFQIQLRSGSATVAAGGTIDLSVVVTNSSALTLSGLDLSVSFPSQQARVTAANSGTLQDGRIVWANGTLAAQQTKTIVFRVQLHPQLQPGSAVHFRATVKGSTGASANAGLDLQVGQAVAQPLPHTGPSDFTGPLGDVRTFLFPFHDGAAAAARAAMFWVLLGIAGFTIGVTQGSRLVRVLERRGRNY